MGDHSYSLPQTPRRRPGRQESGNITESPLTRQSRLLNVTSRRHPYAFPSVNPPSPTSPSSSVSQLTVPLLRSPLTGPPSSVTSPSAPISSLSLSDSSSSSSIRPFFSFDDSSDPFPFDSDLSSILPPSFTFPFVPSPSALPVAFPISGTVSSSTTRSIGTANPLPALSYCNPSARIDEMVGELAHSLTHVMKGKQIPSPRFDQCQKSKAIIRNMSSRLSPDNPLIPIHLSLAQRCTLIGFLTGFHPNQVRRVLSEQEELPLQWCPPCHPPKPTMTAEDRRQRNLEIFCEETRFHLRFFIHGMFREQKRPSLEVLCKAKDDWLKGKDEGRSVCPATVYKCMRAMGFSYRQLTTRVHIFTNPSLSSLRNYYLKTMADLRTRTGSDAPYFGYLDETWIYPGMRHNFCWVDSFVEEDPFLAMKIGLTPGIDPEYKKGERLVLVGVFSEEGFIHRKVYRTGKKEDESCRDYHGEMNSDVFEEYAEGAFAELAARAGALNKAPILIMDNASYHSRWDSVTRNEKEKYTNGATGMFIDFLQRNHIPFNKKMKKNELFSEVIAELDPKEYNRYAVEEIAKKHGVRIVRLPPYHCIYSAIEFAWAWLKGKARDQLSTSDNGETAKAKVEAIFDSFDPSLGPKYLRHVREKEEEHIAKGSLTFDHRDIDTHAYIRAQARADVGLDSHPVPLTVANGEEEEGGDGEAEEEAEVEEEEAPLLDDDGEPLLEDLTDDEEEQYSEQF